MRRLLLVAVLSSTLSYAQQLTPPPVVQHPAFPTGDTAPLGSRIATLLADPTVTRAHWGIAVTALDGTPIYGFDEGKLFRPASNAKLFTTAAAMAFLGPDKTFETRVYGKFHAITGTVTGDLVLLGGGDPDFGNNDLPYSPPSQRTKSTALTLGDLQALADQLLARGVKHVTGNIVGDDSLFPYEPYGESWAQDDMVWGYGAPVSALTLADNELKLTITPLKTLPKPGTGIPINAMVELDQFVPYYIVKGEVETTETAAEARGIQVEREPGSRILRVYGSIARTAAPDVEHVAIDEPALYASMALRAMLTQRGITVDGKPTVNHWPESSGEGFLHAMRQPLGRDFAILNKETVIVDCMLYPPPSGTVLASRVSAPMAEDIVYTLKESQNLHAELFLHHLPGVDICQSRSAIEGAQMARAFLIHAGLDSDDFLFYDGSGLSAKDLVAPRATAKLLSFATTQPWFAQWKAALPIGGIDGTLASRFKEAPLKGHVFAKTGTLGESRALSGYVDCASGKQVIFSIMVDDHSPTTSADRVVMDKIVAAIAETQ